MITLLDGATGTELQRRGFRLSNDAWSAQALIDNPELVREIHLDYLRAGCDVVTTNSFRTTRRALSKIGMGQKAEELTKLSISLAKNAFSSACKPGFVAGSIAPLEDCFSPELSPSNADDEFFEFAEWLVEAGCDLLLIETMNNLQEVRAAIRSAQKCNTDFWLSLNPSNKDFSCLLSGEPILEGLKIAEGEGASAFLVNCAGMKVIENAVQSIVSANSKIPIGGYANNGVMGDDGKWDFSQNVSHREFAMHCKKLAEFGATIIGGCCGITPEHLNAASQELRD